MPEANVGAVNYHKVVLEEATPEDREQRQNHSQRASAERKQRRNHRPRVSGEKKEGSNTGTMTARRACPTAGENQKVRKSIANSRQDKSTANSRQDKSIEDLEEDGKDSKSDTLKESVAKSKAETTPKSETKGCDKAEAGWCVHRDTHHGEHRGGDTACAPRMTSRLPRGAGSCVEDVMCASRGHSRRKRGADRLFTWTWTGSVVRKFRWAEAPCCFKRPVCVRESQGVRAHPTREACYLSCGIVIFREWSSPFKNCKKTC